jgi:hypothetical protein
MNHYFLSQYSIPDTVIDEQMKNPKDGCGPGATFCICESRRNLTFINFRFRGDPFLIIQQLFLEEDYTNLIEDIRNI